MDTLLLDRVTWDLVLTAGGDIAVASNPYSLAQSAANAIKLFQGEYWFNTTIGVPYFGQILGQAPSIAYMKAQFVAAALTVPDVAAAVCYITSISGRTVSGQVLVTDAAGVTSIANF